MIGTWIDFYKFDNEESQKAMGSEKTYFTITINSFDNANSKGTVVDDINTGGMEGTGEITGEIEGDKIAFKKFMPRENIILPNNERRYTNRKHPTLYYKGVFSKDKKEINGTWKFKRQIGFLFGFIPVPYNPGSGKWSMTLQEQ